MRMWTLPQLELTVKKSGVSRNLAGNKNHWTKDSLACQIQYAVAVLSNDHKELSSQMETLIHRLHALSRDSGDAGPAVTQPEEEGIGGNEREGGRAVAAPLAVAAYNRRPFAVIDEVSHASPAETAGLKVGDKIVQFGHIGIETPTPIQAVASLLSTSEGRHIECMVSRGAEMVKLRLMPQGWEGRGLLGCHLTKIT